MKIDLQKYRVTKEGQRGVENCKNGDLYLVEDVDEKIYELLDIIAKLTLIDAQVKKNGEVGYGCGKPIDASLKQKVQCPSCKKYYYKREKNITYHDKLNYCDDCAYEDNIRFLNRKK